MITESELAGGGFTRLRVSSDRDPHGVGECDMTLADAPYASRPVVTRIDARGADRRRLLDLGVLPGVEVAVEGASPMGDPVAYRVLGALIALRHKQARQIRVDCAGCS